MKTPTVKEILKIWLVDNGYDGLWNPSWECGCLLSDDLPCDQCPGDCEAAYRQRGENEDGFGVRMGPEKP